MEIKINQEIKEYNETMFFGLSVRQFIFAILRQSEFISVAVLLWVQKPYLGYVCSEPHPLRLSVSLSITE